MILLAAACVNFPNLLMNSVSSQNLQVLALFAGGVVIAGVRDSNNKFQSPKN